MIVVIADDITGAAELGGIGLRYGLRVRLTNEVTNITGVNLLVVYTNTRSLTKDEAVNQMILLTAQLNQLNPSLFYKKTDSVLRGHVIAEIKQQMKVLNLNKALLVPVNPSLGRTIKNGHYYLNDQPIHQTGFSSDPEFPLRTSFVKDMLGNDEAPLHVLAVDDQMPADGIIVGEAGNEEDVFKWTNYLHESFLLAGGATFFNALLKAMNFTEKQTITNTVKISAPVLLVSGTTYKKNVEKLKLYPRVVSYMPAAVIADPSDKKAFSNWAEEVIQILLKHSKAIIAIPDDSALNADPSDLSDKISKLVKIVLQKIKIRELFIEGGSTAFSIFNSLGWKSFIPTEELQQGIVRMKLNKKQDMHITIKPGSYDWPAEWDFN